MTHHVRRDLLWSSPFVPWGSPGWRATLSSRSASSPAGTRKAGTVYDLPILLGILAAGGDLPPLPEREGERALAQELEDALKQREQEEEG